jgi:hypothetical protein
MSDERSKMKALFARAKATREDAPISPAVPSAPFGAKETFTVPRCSHCGAPSEVAEDRAALGALLRICRYCNTPREA